MGVNFTANDILDMARTIERNAQAFYTKAALGQKNAGNREFLSKLARMEVEHERIFAEMQQSLTLAEREKVTFDPDSEESLYLATTADLHGGEGTPAITARITGAETLEQILRIAIDLERRSILFFVGMQAMVPQKRGQEHVTHVLWEERAHVAMLARELNALRKSGGGHRRNAHRRLSPSVAHGVVSRACYAIRSLTLASSRSGGIGFSTTSLTGSQLESGSKP